MRRITCLLLCLIMSHAAGIAAAEAPARHAVDVYLDQRSDVDLLSGQGIIVESVRGRVARVSVTDAELAALSGAGWRHAPTPPAFVQKNFSGYHNYDDLTAELQAYADAYPDIARLYTLGQSVRGRELWVLLITDHPDIEEDEPEFKYLSTMHGDEPVGTELCLRLIDYLLTGYSSDTRAAALVDETAIWILPLMNPDGRENATPTRANAHGLDLNRSFPKYPDDFQTTYYDGGEVSIAGREPEVAHVMNWSLDHSFVLSANMHTGSLVVNYPYDAGDVPSGVAAISPDESLFQFLSVQYSSNNPPMYASDDFALGITNGSAWYRIDGGMQDWNYRYLGCFEVTLELSDIKWPSSAQLGTFWSNNRESLLAYLESVHLGVRGVATSRQTGEPLACKIMVEGNAQPVFSDPDVGDFYRLLLPGTYTLTITAEGVYPYRVPGVHVNAVSATRIDVGLSNGDVIVDGIVDALDMQRVLKGILRGERDTAADVDGGGVTVTDLQRVVNRALERQVAPESLKVVLQGNGGTFPGQ